MCHSVVSTVRHIVCLILSLLLASCIMDSLDDCPPEGVPPGDPKVDPPADPTPSGRIFVAARAVDGTPYDTPLNTRFTTLTLQRHCHATDTYHTEQIPIDHDGTLHELDAKYFQDGLNELLLVGGGRFATRNFTPEDGTIALHPEGRGLNRVLVGADSVQYPVVQDVTIWMEPVKGGLQVDPSQLPEGVTGIDVRVENVYSELDYGDTFAYDGETTVIQHFDLTGTDPIILIVAPTALPTVADPRDVSPVMLTLTYADGHTEDVPAIPVTIERGELTVVRPTLEHFGWQLEVFIDGRWEAVEPLVLT